MIEFYDDCNNCHDNEMTHPRPSEQPVMSSTTILWGTTFWGTRYITNHLRWNNNKNMIERGKITTFLVVVSIPARLRPFTWQWPTPLYWNSSYFSFRWVFSIAYIATKEWIIYIKLYYIFVLFISNYIYIYTPNRERILSKITISIPNWFAVYSYSYSRLNILRIHSIVEWIGIIPIRFWFFSWDSFGSPSAELSSLSSLLFRFFLRR